MSNKKNYSSYDDFYRNLHTSGASIIEFNNGRAPCIGVGNEQFRKFLNYARGPENGRGYESGHIP